MNGVVSMAELLGETVLDADQRLYADTIRHSGEALLVIINDILDYSKIEAGKLALHEAEFDLLEVILGNLQAAPPRGWRAGTLPSSSISTCHGRTGWWAIAGVCGRSCST